VAAITIRNIDDDLKRKLRLRAAANNRSMEEEARVILQGGLIEGGRKGLGTEIRDRFAAVGGVELQLPPRGPDREPPDFR
jgi:plasmid stability protein